jgi:hypothetical protein
LLVVVAKASRSEIGEQRIALGLAHSRLQHAAEAIGAFLIAAREGAELGLRDKVEAKTVVNAFDVSPRRKART